MSSTGAGRRQGRRKPQVGDGRRCQQVPEAECKSGRALGPCRRLASQREFAKVSGVGRSASGVDHHVCDHAARDGYQQEVTADANPLITTTGRLQVVVAIIFDDILTVAILLRDTVPFAPIRVLPRIFDGAGACVAARRWAAVLWAVSLRRTVLRAAVTGGADPCGRHDRPDRRGPGHLEAAGRPERTRGWMTPPCRRREQSTTSCASSFFALLFVRSGDRTRGKHSR